MPRKLLDVSRIGDLGWGASTGITATSADYARAAAQQLAGGSGVPAAISTTA